MNLTYVTVRSPRMTGTIPTLYYSLLNSLCQNHVLGLRVDLSLVRFIGWVEFYVQIGYIYDVEVKGTYEFVEEL